MILYFSGTGNSRHVAMRLSELIADEHAPTALGPDSIQTEVAATTDVSRVVWVFPIHAWGVPRHVLRAIAALQLPENAVHYMVCTCGDDIGMAHLAWRRAIGRRGWRSAGEFSVTMPNTYVLLPGFDVDASSMADDKLRRADDRLHEIASIISRGDEATMVTTGALPRLKSHVLRPLFERLLTDPAGFGVDPEACKRCSRCADACPVSNISYDPSGLPQWGDACTMCLGCLHACPHRAVAYRRRPLLSSHGKGRYYLTKQPAK